MKQVLVCILCLSISLHAFGQRNYNEPYSGKFLDRVAFPIGGMGAGMFCLEGTGAVSHMSVRHHMDFFNEPGMFAAIHLKGVKNGSKVLEIKCPDWKKFGAPNPAAETDRRSSACPVSTMDNSHPVFRSPRSSCRTKTYP